MPGLRVAWWGEHPARTGHDGHTDRSATLFQTGLPLARANASHQAIAAALAERDESLCFEKYTGRKDAVTRYAEIAQRVIVERQQAGRGPVTIRFLEGTHE